MSKYLQIALLFLSSLAVSSCIKDSFDDPPHAERVVLVYLGGDNDLDGYAWQKLMAIRDGWDGDPYHRIVVYMDTGNASLMEITLDDEGNKIFTTIADYHSENSASPEVLGRVISDVKQLSPQANFGLLIFSHASGWLPEGMLENPFGSSERRAFQQSATTRSHADTPPRECSVIIDDGHRAEMSLTDLAAAIPDGMFDYIVFEACFMGGIEVAYQLRGKTPIILASAAEIVDPGFTEVYPRSMEALLTGDLQHFAYSAFNHITTTYAVDNIKHSATFSIIDTGGLDELASFIKENCDTSIETDVADIQHFDRYPEYRLFFDFEDYYARLLCDETKREELTALIEKCVVHKSATSEFMTQKPGYHGFRIDRHSGLTTYIQQPQFPLLNSEYEKLDWYGAIN